MDEEIFQESCETRMEEKDNDWAARIHNREYRGFTKESEGKWKEPFYFLQLADTQLGFFEGAAIKK